MRRRPHMVNFVLVRLLFTAVACMSLATPLLAEDLARGQKVYDDQGCAACHSIAGKGNRRHPLDGVGTRLSEQQIRLWITAPTQVDPKVRKRAFDSLPADDLAALIAYVRSLPAL